MWERDKLPPRAEYPCPYCGEETDDGEYVDVGVGGKGVQVSPRTCGHCGAAQIGANGEARNDVEVRTGWYAPEGLGIYRDGVLTVNEVRALHGLEPLPDVAAPPDDPSPTPEPERSF